VRSPLVEPERPLPGRLVKPLRVVVLRAVAQALADIPEAASGGRHEVLDLLGVCIALQFDDGFRQLVRELLDLSFGPRWVGGRRGGWCRR